MELAIQLYGYLILTFLAIVTPIFVILLSIFREGLSKLTEQYESQSSQTEVNIKTQVKEIANVKKANIPEIEKALNELKSILGELKLAKKNAETKLAYLNPKRQMLRLFRFLLFSFLGVILAIFSKNNIYLTGLFIVASLVCFGIVVVGLWKLLDVIIEVKETIDEDKKDRETKTIELLSTLAEKETEIFLKKVYITINDKDIKDDEGEIIMRLNNKKSLAIGIKNYEKKMAKNVEIGFILEPHFIIEKKDYYSIYTDKTRQIVRYSMSQIHGVTYQIFDPMIVTPIKEGQYKMKTFLKAENIQSTSKDLKLKVQKVTWEDVEEKLLGSQEAGLGKEKE